MAAGTPAGKRLVLRLYVAGRGPNSVIAIANLRAICASDFAEHTLEIVDVLTQPARAVADGVIVTPTLLKLSPRPQQRVIGNLSDTSLVRLTLARK